MPERYVVLQDLGKSRDGSHLHRLVSEGERLGDVVDFLGRSFVVRDHSRVVLVGADDFPFNRLRNIGDDCVRPGVFSTRIESVVRTLFQRVEVVERSVFESFRHVGVDFSDDFQFFRVGNRGFVDSEQFRDDSLLGFDEFRLESEVREFLVECHEQVGRIDVSDSFAGFLECFVVPSVDDFLVTLDDFQSVFRLDEDFLRANLATHSLLERRSMCVLERFADVFRSDSGDFSFESDCDFFGSFQEWDRVGEYASGDSSGRNVSEVGSRNGCGS